MDYVNGDASRKAYEYLQENASSITIDELNITLQKAIAAPALANAALLAAKGCTTTFITLVNSLYMSNDLPLPDFSELQEICPSKLGAKDNKPTLFNDPIKAREMGMSTETVDFTGINEELKHFNNNFYTITETSPPEWEDWFDEDNHSNVSFRPVKPGSLSSGISVTSLASTNSSSDISRGNTFGQYYNTSCNVSMINPPSNSLRHSSSSGISVASFASSSESLDIPNVSAKHSKIGPFSSTPLSSDLRAALSPIKLALARNLKPPEKKRSSLSPKRTLPQNKDPNNLHRHLLSSKIAESSNYRYPIRNRLSLSPRKTLTPFTTPDLSRFLPSSKNLVPNTPVIANIEINSATQDSYKTTNSRTFDSSKGLAPFPNQTIFSSPSSGTFDLTADTNTSPWVVVRSHGFINSDINITNKSREETFHNAAKKILQRCRAQLF